MVWLGFGLVVVGVVVAARAVWSARRAPSTGAHGMVIAVGAALAFWGVVLGIVHVVRNA
jgi:hypothetical protein